MSIDSNEEMKLMENRTKYILIGIIIGIAIGMILFYLLMTFRIIRPFGFDNFSRPFQRR